MSNVEEKSEFQNRNEAIEKTEESQEQTAEQIIREFERKTEELRERVEVLSTRIENYQNQKSLNERMNIAGLEKINEQIDKDIAQLETEREALLRDLAKREFGDEEKYLEQEIERIDKKITELEKVREVDKELRVPEIFIERISKDIEKLKKEKEEKIRELNEKKVQRIREYEEESTQEETTKEGEESKENKGPEEESKKEREETPEEGREKIEVKGIIVEIEDIVKDLAILEANRRFGELEREGKWFNPIRIVKRFLLAANPDGWWLHFYKQALDSIHQNKNLMAEIEARLKGKAKALSEVPEAEKRHYEVLDEIIESYTDQLVREEEVVDKNVVDPEIQKELAEILVKHWRGEFSQPGMSEEEVRRAFDKAVKENIIDRLIEKHKLITGERHARTIIPEERWKDLKKRWKSLSKEERAEIISKESIYAHNFWNIAEKYKKQMTDLIEEKANEFSEDNREDIVNYVNGLLSLDLTLGVKDPDIYQEDYRKLIQRWEKSVRFSERHRYLGSIVANPMLAGLSGSIAGNIVGRNIAKMALTAGLATLAGISLPVATILGGAGATAFVVARRERKKLREELRRVMRDTALGFEPGGPKAQELREKGGCSVANSREFVEKIRKLREKSSLDENDKNLISEALARRDLERQIGVILLQSVGEASKREKVRLSALNDLDREIKQTLSHFGLNPEDLSEKTKNYITSLKREIEEKDQQFKEYLRKKQLIAGIGGAALGLVFGGATYFGSRYVVEHFAPNSPVARLFEWWEGGKRPPVEEGVKGTNLQEVVLPGLSGKIKIPEGYSLVPDKGAGEGFFDLVGPKGKVLVDNLQIDKNGKLTEASRSLLEKAGFTLKEQVREITETRHIPVDEWWKEKIGRLREFQRVDWHDEKGRPVSLRNLLVPEYEGKQQQFFIKVDKEGIKLDFRKMMEDIIYNLKNKEQWEKEGIFKKLFGVSRRDWTVDKRLQHLADQLTEAYNSGTLHEKFGINAIPTQNADKKGLSTFLGSLNENYYLRLDPEKAKLLFDEQALKEALNKAAKEGSAWLREGDLRVDHLEFYFGDEKSGHVFATCTGKNNLREIISEIKKTVFDYLITKIPKKEVWFFPPIPVIGFWPRRVPEKGVPTEWPGIVYYPRYGEIEPSEYEKRRSPRFRDPTVELNEKEEVEWYFNKQSEDYKKELEELDSQIGQPMHQDCRLVVAIPAYKEGSNIYHTLEQYLNQKDGKGKDGEEIPFNPNEFEIIILDNHPEDETRDNTKEEVLRFKKEHPEINVHYVYKVFKKDQARIGNIRKYLNDLALLRGKKRGFQPKELILVSNDADLEKIFPNYLNTIKEFFDKHKKVEAITGKLDYPKEAYLELPIIHSARRLWQYLDIILRYKYVKAPELMGANSSIRAKTYAALGGYNPWSSLGEDVELGWMLRSARGNKAPDYIKYINKAVVYTDPRRAISAYIKNLPHVKQHQDFVENREVRELTWEELLLLIPEEERRNFEREVFEKEADAVYQYYANSTWLPKVDFERYFKRAMKFLGAEYKIEQGRVKVTSVKKLETGLKNFRKKMEEEIKRRESKSEPRNQKEVEGRQANKITTKRKVRMK